MPNPPSKMAGGSSLLPLLSKKHEIVLFSSTAIALYGYDQGMMSLINTNYSYLRTMQISEESPIVGIIVSVYYLGCTLGAIAASWLADKQGRKWSIFTCLATTSFGNILMFISGLSMSGSSPWNGGAIACMLAGRVIMGLGVGGIDAVIPVYSSELSSDGARGKALAQEFQMNIFGLLMAYGINLGVTIGLGKWNQWAWRIPIIVMQIFPLVLMSVSSALPESPRWLISKGKKDAAKRALETIYDKEEAKNKLDEMQEADDNETEKTGYKDMLIPGGSQFHPSMVTVMGQVNQALTGYGAVSVYGPQIFELLGFKTRMAEYLTLANYIQYFLMMTVAWLSIDVLGRRKLMVWGAIGLTTCFAILTIFGGLAQEFPSVPALAAEIPGSITLFVATAIFGIGWLATVWLIPTEIYPSTARAQGSAISVIIWGLANFAITLLTPIGFNNLKYWLFLVFAVTNCFAGWWTWRYTPESGGRSFEENQEFFDSAREEGSWVVRKVDGGKFVRMPGKKESGGEEGENSPLLGEQR
ncbi:general substrate transporter [Mollisia scopiformis]|uniref:General substrate transporter n=1 Tax=Mollisia scopiformis TaxID=149040 RepID=A0A194X6I0_MOLSC|nr:general substrate transporter [Mollisia scopiformis]KUJ15780.1 general substrate transporter [Mollisia scopiformis]